jgi:hypothetical protein
MVDPDIHTPGDGRGGRVVFCNGKPVKNVVYADVRRGIVRYQGDPPRLDKHGKKFIERTRRGKVEVRPISEVFWKKDEKGNLVLADE